MALLNRFGIFFEHKILFLNINLKEIGNTDCLFVITKNTGYEEKVSF